MPNATIYQGIGQRIRALRKGRGWRQADLAARLTPPRSHVAVSAIERGQTKLNLEELDALATVLGVPVQEVCDPQYWHAAARVLVYPPATKQ